MVVFKMRYSVPSARYSPVCNVLRLWKTSLIPILESTDSISGEVNTKSGPYIRAVHAGYNGIQRAHERKYGAPEIMQACTSRVCSLNFIVYARACN